MQPQSIHSQPSFGVVNVHATAETVEAAFATQGTSDSYLLPDASYLLSLLSSTGQSRHRG